jgi:hypothetical protein
LNPKKQLHYEKLGVKRLAYLENIKIVELQEYVSSSGISNSNSLNKAKRQTIEAFLDRNT